MIMRSIPLSDARSSVFAMICASAKGNVQLTK